jgi:hypothetical protein
VAESKTKKKYDGDTKVVIGFVPSTMKRKVAPDKAKDTIQLMAPSMQIL